MPRNGGRFHSPEQIVDCAASQPRELVVEILVAVQANRAGCDLNGAMLNVAMLIREIIR
jgi:hypothetical protein